MIHVILHRWRSILTITGIGAVLCVATLLRWPMIHFALPYTPHPDEPYVINMIFDMLRRNDWIPNNFERPHLSVYLAYIAVWLGTWWHPIDSTVLSIPTDRITVVPQAFVDARTAMVCTGVASILAAYWHLRQREFTWGAWVGMLWLAFLPWHQEQSGLITPDVMVGLFTFLIAVYAWKYAQHATTLRLWVLALVIGMATGTKYNIGAAIIIPVILQWPLLTARMWRAILRNGLIIGAGSFIGFLLTTPGILWSLTELQNNLGYQMYHYDRPDGSTNPWDWQYYLWFFQHQAWLWVGSMFAIVGISIIIKQRRLVDISLLVFFVVQILFFMSRERHYMRNLMPIVVFGVVYMVIGATWLIDQLKRWIQPYTLRVAIVAVVLLIQPLAQGLEFHTFMERPYNMLQVDHYTTSHPRGGILLCSFEAITVPITPSCDAIVTKQAEFADWKGAGVQQIVINRTQYPSWQLPSSWQRVAQIPGSKAGGNGEMYDIYRDPSARAITVGTSATTSDGIQIDGVRLGYTDVRDRITPLYATQRVATGGTVLNINAYFTVTVPVSEPGWWLFVHLIDAQGNKVAERATVPRSDYAIATWQAGEQVVVNADLPASLPAGDYVITLGFFRPSDGARMIISNSNEGSWQIPISIIP